MKYFFQKLFEVIKKRKIAIIILAIIWIVLLSILNPFSNSNSLAAERYYGGSTDGSVQIVSGNIYTQQMPCSINGLCEIILTFFNSNTDAKTNVSTVIINLLNSETGQIVTSTSLPGSIIASKYMYKWDFDPLIDSKGKNYMIQIACEGCDSPETGISVSTHGIQNSSDINATINGETQSYEFTFSAKFRNNITSMIYLLMWMVLIISSFLCTLLLNEKFERNFLLISIPVCLMYLFFNPFPHQCDEATHFFRSFQISEGNFEDVVDEDGNIGGYIPENYPKSDFRFSLLNWYANRDTFNKPYSDQVHFESNAYMSSYNPIDHSVSALGIALARMFHFSIAWVIILSRLFVCLFYIIICYFAIRKVRYYSSIFFGISLFPFSLYLAGSCSQDPILSAACIYFISSWANLYFSDDTSQAIGIRELLPMLLIIPFIASCKYLIYIPIFLLFLLIPKKRFKGKSRLIFCMITLCLCALFLVYQLHLINAFPYTEDRNGDVNVKEQISFVFDNLYYTYRNFLVCFIDSVIHKYTALVIPASGALSNLTCSYLTAIIIVFGSIFIKDKYEWTDKKAKRNFVISALCISIIIYFLIIAAEYIGFTPVGQWGVEGFSDRYVIPFAPLVCLALSCIPVINGIKDYEYKHCYILSVINFVVLAQACLIV